MAFNNALNLFQTHDRTCVIHPMGTGKAVIIAQFISLYPLLKHLVLAPGTHIHDEIRGHTNNEPVYYLTYQAINEENITKLTGFDYIYTDEFHSLGAEVWGDWALKVLAQNLKAKIFGTSATPIRYLDGGRDRLKRSFMDVSRLR